jgi:hypothetical protein
MGLGWNAGARSLIPGPDRRADLTMTFEALGNRTLLFGGTDRAGRPKMNDTWTFKDGLWKRVSDIGPQLFTPQMVQVASSVILFGESDTWNGMV